MPRQFSWIDQRLVRDRHIQGRSPDALALYLFLCTVADAQGVSYYADASVAKLLSFERAPLRLARAELVAAGLIAWRAPFYQVLSLEPGDGAAAAPSVLTPSTLTPAASPPATPTPGDRPLEVPALRTGGQARSIGEIVRAMMKEAAKPPAP